MSLSAPSPPSIIWSFGGALSAATAAYGWAGTGLRSPPLLARRVPLPLLSAGGELECIMARRSRSCDCESVGVMAGGRGASLPDGAASFEDAAAAAAAFAGFSFLSRSWNCSEGSVHGACGSFRYSHGSSHGSYLAWSGSATLPTGRTSHGPMNSTSSCTSSYDECIAHMTCHVEFPSGPVWRIGWCWFVSMEERHVLVYQRVEATIHTEARSPDCLMAALDSLGCLPTTIRGTSRSVPVTCFRRRCGFAILRSLKNCRLRTPSSLPPLLCSHLSSRSMSSSLPSHPEMKEM
mmetsp:Transcript_165/g.540  ORF Transcript_165/g.540 Transcript_165/m.540 type:complete len:292 (-) Transcript_165:500-1375(-)